MFGNYPLKIGNRAQALILAYIIIAVFAIVSSALLSKAVNERNWSLRNKLNSEAFYMAEGATENAISVFLSSIANYQIDPDIASFNVTTVFNSFGNSTVNSLITRLDNDSRLILEGQTNILVRNYEVVSTATHPLNSAITVTIHQIIARRLIPTFQHAVFYNDDLEMLPGADMNLSGRIHCNKDIYMDTHSNFTIDSIYLHSGGNIYNQRKDSPEELEGNVAIRVNKTGSPKYEDMDSLDSDCANWTTEAVNRWQGSVQSAVHGITKLAAPSVGSISTNGYYASKANVTIENDIIKKDGVVLVEGSGYPNGTIINSTEFFNNREGKNVKMATIDLRKLANLDGDISPNTGQPFPNNLPANGLLYATRNDNSTAYQPGIRLVNASRINRNGGLTIVSNDPVYLLGDFNNVDEKPVSVICDSLNLLSNSWNDTNSHLGLSSRAAAETTVNAAFIAGVDTTTSGQYNGGLENYPRLHEKWSGVKLNIKGSFVALWNSLIATGSWIYGSPQYEAPKRYWSYNTDFNNPNNLPPFTPWAVEAQRIAWWKE